MIKCLPEEVKAKLRSGIAIFSLQQCVEELFLNSIDSGATCVAVKVNIEDCKVQVIDNGSGMDREDMERVGNRYCTSKCCSLEDLDNLRFYGFRGEAVASIVSLSTRVEITSRTKLSVKTFVKVFKEGKGLDVFEAETTRPSTGTTVVISNFFHNMPVRQKRMDAVLEIERIRQREEAISLMHPSVSFTLKNECTGAMVVQLSKARNTYYRFVQIHGMGRAQRLGEVSHSFGQFEMSGHLGREGHYNNSLQFLFVNGRLLLKTRIHKLLNSLLRKMNSLSRQNSSPSASPGIGSPKQRSGAELHGVYVVNIKCHYSEYDICLEPAKTLIEFKDWEGVLLCVEEGVKAFLTRENLMADLPPEDVQDYVSQNVCSRQVVNLGRGEDKVQCFTRECNEGKTLSSRAVHRRPVDDLKDKESDCHEGICDGIDKADQKGDAVPEVQRRLELVLEPVSSDTECGPSSVETEREAQQYCFISTTAELPFDNSKNEILYGHQTDVVCCDERDSGLPLSIRVTEGENLMMSTVDGKESEVSSRKPETLFSSNVTLLSHDTQNIQTDMVISTEKMNLHSFGFIKHALLPQPQNTGEQGYHVKAGRKKISLSDPNKLTGGLHPQTCAFNPKGQCQTTKYLEKTLCVPKRKLSLFEDQNLKENCYSVCDTPSRTPKVTCPKLTLSSEAGSLDNFRKIYGGQAEAKHQSIDTNNNHFGLYTTASRTVHTALHVEQDLFFNEGEKENDTNKVNPCSSEDSPITLSTYTKLKCVSAQSRSNKIFLAAKLSHLKHQRVEDKKHVSDVPLRDITKTYFSIRDAPSNTATQDISSGGKPSDALLSHEPLPENNVNSLVANVGKNNVTLECSGLSEAVSSHHGDESSTHIHSPPSNTAPTFATEESWHCSQTVSSSGSNFPSSGVVTSIGQHRPLPSSTGDERKHSGEGPRSQPEGVIAALSDWLTHYDDSVGKLVYINTVTGLSKYEAPSVEESQVSCTTDVTNMAVSVISKNGIEYRCYPFQTDVVLPFLPKSRAERVRSSGTDNRADLQAPNLLSSLFSEWTNPVFVRPPDVAVDVTSGQAEGLAVKIHHILFPYRFTKDMIHSMKVIHQVDKKFLACVINTRDQETTHSSETEGNLLVLVDQHAAHERVRLERLVADSYEDDPEAPGERRMCSSSVTPPLEVSVTEEELRLLRSCQPFLRGLGLELGFPRAGGPRVLLGKVPGCFVEKEGCESRRGRQSVSKSVVEEYLREQIELLGSTGRVKGTLPLTVLKVLASQACHGAIKFNDSLSKEECCSLVGSLSSCQLPFQCAHGRPSIAPLVDLLHMGSEQQELPRPNLKKLRRMYKAWQLYGRK